MIIYTQLPRFNQTTWAPQLEECTKLQQKLSEVPDDVSERPDAKNMLVSPEMVEREHAKQGQAAARLQEGVQSGPQAGTSSREGLGKIRLTILPNAMINNKPVKVPHFVQIAKPRGGEMPKVAKRFLTAATA